jgi:hypothetical protein
VALADTDCVRTTEGGDTDMAEQERDRGSGGAGEEATAAAIRALARPHVRAAIKTLVEVMTDGDRDALRLAAACRLLDLAVGKAGQSVDESEEERNRVINETLAQMRERARRLRPRNGGSARDASS